MLTISSILGLVSSFTTTTTTTTNTFMNYNALHTNHYPFSSPQQLPILQQYSKLSHYSIQTTNHRIQQSLPKTTTQLYMTVTKSGGRPISSNEQFQLEVLNTISPSGGAGMEDSIVDDINLEGEEKDDVAAATTVVVDGKGEDKEDKPVLVFFSAPWCGPCRLSNPVVKEIIKEYVPIIDVVEVCTDDLPDVAESAGVVSIPTIQLYYKGELLDTIVGCVAKNVLSAAVLKVLEDLGFEEVEEEDEDDLMEEDEGEYVEE